MIVLNLHSVSYLILISSITINQDRIKDCQSRKPELQEINGDADVLLDNGRLDEGDAERVERTNESLSARFTAINDKLVETQSK